MRRLLAFAFGMAIVTTAFWALATVEPVGWIPTETDEPSTARLQSVLRDAGESRTLTP